MNKKNGHYGNILIKENLMVRMVVDINTFNGTTDEWNKYLMQETRKATKTTESIINICFTLLNGHFFIVER
jgi:hypothetical protein